MFESPPTSNSIASYTNHGLDWLSWAAIRRATHLWDHSGPLTIGGRFVIEGVGLLLYLVLRCINICLDILRCINMCLDVLRCIEIHQDVFRCTKIYLLTCIQMY